MTANPPTTQANCNSASKLLQHHFKQVFWIAIIGIMKVTHRYEEKHARKYHADGKVGQQHQRQQTTPIHFHAMKLRQETFTLYT